MSESVFNNAIYLDDVPESDWLNYIGKGYRSVVYTTDSERNGKIILFGYDVSGNPKTFVCPHRSWIKYRVKYDTDEHDLYDKYVATKTFRSSYERKKYLEGAQGIKIVEALRPEQEFLQKLFYKFAFDSDFNKQTLKTFTIDIETEISDQFMKPSVAENRINMVTVHDSETNIYYTWSLSHADKKFVEEPLCNYSLDRFEIFEFNDNEPKMLEHFLSWWEDNYPDVVTGWNIRGYDMPYIFTRVKKVLGDSEVKRLSPVGKVFAKEVNHDNERADVAAEIEVDVAGVFIADSLVLYRDKFHVKGALDGGYNLSNVGEAEGLGRKIEYDGTLKDLYLKDWQKFYEYNVRDVDLCVKIEEKCKMIPLARQITSSGLCNYNTIYSSISYLIGSLIAYAKVHMNCIFNSYVAEKGIKVPYEGAYVIPPTVGVYHGGIATVDVNSLYPSTIRSINLSPETYIGKILIYLKTNSGEISCNTMNEVHFDPYNDSDSEWGTNDDGETVRTVINAGDPNIVKIELKLANNTRKPLTIESLKKLIDTKCIYTMNNTLFMKHEIKWGVVAKWCEHFYSLRKSTKKEMGKYDKMLYEKKITDPEEVKKTETLIQNLNSAQLGYKTMINSVYGILGTNFSPIYNPDLAQSITRNGRFFNINATKHTKDFFMEKFGVDENYVTSASGDTDSCIGSTKLRIRRCRSNKIKACA